jgi:uncharacterized DUF497 family protein
MKFIFDEEKDKKLFKERGVTFKQVIEAITDGKVLHDTAHPNKEKYPHQRLMIVDLDNYTYGVPYLQNEEEIVLKTIYPDRRYKKLLEKKNDKN